MALAGATVAAAAAVGAGVAATSAAGPAPVVALDRFGARLDASQRAAQGAAQQNPLLTGRQDATAAMRGAQARILQAQAAAVAAARQAAAKRAAAQAAARASAQASAQAPVATAAQPASAPAQPSGSAQQIAAGMLSSFGWSADQFSCLDSLWNRESGWSVSASNPTSGAYGIPQALPGSKMASAGADWQTNPATQIRWGLGYIQSTYGSPCAAWSHSQASGWY